MNHFGMLVALDNVGMDVTLQPSALYYHWLVRKLCPSLVDMLLGCCRIDSASRTTSFPGCRARDFVLLWYWTIAHIFQMVIQVAIKAVAFAVALYAQLGNWLISVCSRQGGWYWDHFWTNAAIRILFCLNKWYRQL